MIKDLAFLPIWNSRGERTIKVFLKTEKGNYCSSAPSGKSKGKYEAEELPVSSALKAAQRIRKNMIGMRENDLGLFDDFLKSIGGKRFKNIGSNLSIALSIACIRAAADKNIWKLLDSNAKIFPLPLSNIIGGGAHGGFTDIQEFLVFPKNPKNIFEAIETNISIWKEISSIFKLKGYLHGRNDEGALISRLNDYKSLDLISSIAKEHKAGIGIDVAASQLFKNGRYVYSKLGKKFDSEEQLDFMLNLIKMYKIEYVEDPFHENDFEGFAELRRRANALIVGDDLTVTSKERIKTSIVKKSINGIIIKPNQIGTVSDTLDAIKLAKDNKLKIIVSHRSGETNDSFISDLAVGVGADMIKCGISGGERFAKLNRLVEIWYSMNSPKMTTLKI